MIDITAQKQIEVEDTKIVKKWKNFRDVFWIIFILTLLHARFAVVIASVLGSGGIWIQIALWIVIARLISVHAYEFTKKKKYKLLGLLGFSFFSLIGYFIVYYLYKTSKNNGENNIKESISSSDSLKIPKKNNI